MTDPRYADHYRNSEAHLRAEFLVQVLQQDLGVKYDMTAAGNSSFKDSRVAFIHGMIPEPGQTIADTPGGTCASMPVMYVAIGRRLGYPLKLVTTNSHIFVRWDGKDHPKPTWRERFNIEGAGQGFGSYDDDHYKTWPFKVTDEEVRANGYLISLTPMEELASFLAARGHCGQDNDEPGFAARCYENAYCCNTSRPAYRSWFLDAARQSGYQPTTPALASLLEARSPRLVVARHTALDMDDLMPSAVARSTADSLLPMPHVSPWQPMATGVPQMPQPGIPQPYQPLPYKPNQGRP